MKWNERHMNADVEQDPKGPKNLSRVEQKCCEVSQGLAYIGTMGVKKYNI